MRGKHCTLSAEHTRVTTSGPQPHPALTTLPGTKRSRNTHTHTHRSTADNRIYGSYICGSSISSRGIQASPVMLWVCLRQHGSEVKGTEVELTNYRMSPSGAPPPGSDASMGPDSRSKLSATSHQIDRPDTQTKLPTTASVLAV